MGCDSQTNVRRAEYKDLKKVMELYKQLNPNVDFESINPVVLESHWKEIKRDNSYQIYILENKKKEILTVCTFTVLKNLAQGLKPNVMIESFITDEKHRGNGYGQKLLKYLLDLAKDLDCHKVMLMIKPENRKARSFYEKVGFDSKIRDGLSIIVNPI